MNSWNNADELSQVSSINWSGPCCCKLFIVLCMKVRHTGTLHWNLFPFWPGFLSQRFNLDAMLCLVSGHIDTYCMCS